MSTSRHISVSTGEHRRELAHRSNNGIHVSLLWSPNEDSLTVTVVDGAAGTFDLEVDPGEALDVFNHPYAYAAARGYLETADVVG